VVIVRFTDAFEKELKKQCSKAVARKIVEKLRVTKPTDGDHIALVTGVLLKERRINTFRFYFIQHNTRLEYLSEEELKNHVLQFIALSKKNNQQAVIDKLKDDLEKAGFRL